MRTLLLLCMIAMTGCVDFSGLRKNLEASKNNYIKLQGSVSGEASSSDTVIVLVTGPNGRNDIQTYRVLEGPGHFELTTLVNARRIVAFADRNNDYLRQENEPVAFFELLDAAGQRNNVAIELKIKPSPASERTPDISAKTLDHTSLDGIKVNFGTHTQIDNQAFSKANIDLGMWRPLDFLKSGVAGIYQIGDKKPRDEAVLFVHGLFGSPKDLSPIISGLKAEKYSKYVYFYPSGMDILEAGKALHGILAEMYAKGRFTKLSIVAHSMGGLVSKAFVNTCVKWQDCMYLDSLITLASPFGGDSAAALGVNHAPVVAPVWRSMLPEGAFISGLFEPEQLADLKHFLVFAYRNASVVSKESGDGTVPLYRQLPRQAQEQAHAIRGFDADHTEILSNAEVIQYINQLIH